MAKILTRILHGILMIIVSAGFFMGSFFYETNFTKSVVLIRENQVTLENHNDEKTEINRAGVKQKVSSGSVLQVGDIVYTDLLDNSQIRFAGDGVLRLSDHTRVLVSYADVEHSSYSFKLIEGKAWLNNLYSTANVNLVIDGAVILPGQSVSYYQTNEGKTEIYANKSNLTVNFISPDYAGNQILEANSDKFINSLFLPQGTEAMVFKSKIAENQQTISKLLFSKLIKEFNYGLFDKSRLSDDLWLSGNLEQDSALASAIKNERLKQIRVRGLKYSNFDSANYKLDQFLRELANTMTFSDEKIGNRNLDALYDDLYDAQYLFDNGRMEEGRNRLDQFSAVANQLFMVYGDQLKLQFKDRIKKEYEYLSFVEPSDSLYQLKLVLEKIYLDSIKGEPAELALKFTFLTEKLNALGYFADSKQIKDLKSGFDDYMNILKDLMKTYSQQLAKDLTPIQQQNQAMDNLFLQYPDFYRVNYMTNKLYLENQYLSLLPSSKDKLEEIQTVIAQRISFLKQLQNFFLAGDVPLLDAQNIVALLFSEIGKIELPSEYQVAVSQLFNDRLQDYGVFSRFLGSPEYVDSKIKGITMRDRFEAFKKDYQEVVSIDTLRQELGGGQVTGTSTDTTTTVSGTDTSTTTTVQPAGNTTSTTDSTAVSTQPVEKPRVPRVKPAN